MKLHQTLSQGLNLISGYGQGYIEIGAQRFSGSLLLTPQTVVPWDVSSWQALTPEHFLPLLAYSPEIVLIGTGNTQRFLPPPLTQALTEAGIGIEMMDTPAACRCFNILLAEERSIAAALLSTET